MNESRLGEDLKTLAQRRPPNLPADFQTTVWSKIQSREATTRSRGRGNWFGTLLAAFATWEWAAAALAIAVLAGWGLREITTRSTMNSRATALVSGEVIDLACYFDDGGSGPAHAACARACIASGLPVGLKTKNGKIYVLIGKQEPPQPQPAPKHETLNAQLAPYAAKIVTVSGTIVTKEGQNVIENAQLVPG
jgi:hypothetical protein